MKKEELVIFDYSLKLNKKSFVIYFFEIIFLFLSFTTVFILSDTVENMRIIGYLIIFISIWMIVKSKKNKMLLLLFSIISFINISIAVNDLIFMGEHVALWQSRTLRSTEFNIYTAKSILLFISILNLFITQKLTSLRPKIISNEKNTLIVVTGIVVVLLTLLYGVFTLQINSSGYVSVTNPIFEYSIMIWVFIWFYSYQNKLVNYLFLVYVLIFLILFLSVGDRSSVFMYIVLIALIYFSRYLTILTTFVLAIFAITFANIIAFIRNSNDFDSMGLLMNVLERGLYTDTVSYAYYTSITLSSLFHLDDNHFRFIIDQFFYIVTGISNTYSNLGAYARENYLLLYNNGGGLFTSYFYASLGYLGVILGAIVLGFIILRIFSSNNKYSIIFQILIIVYSLRWYLYSPLSLFRVIFINAVILLLICILVNKMTQKMKK